MEKVKKIAVENATEIHLSSGEVPKGRVKIVEEAKLAIKPMPGEGGNHHQLDQLGDNQLKSRLFEIGFPYV